MIGSYNAFASMGFIIGPTVGAHIAQREGGFQTVCLISAGAFIFNAGTVQTTNPNNLKMVFKN